MNTKYYIIEIYKEIQQFKSQMKKKYKDCYVSTTFVYKLYLDAGGKKNRKNFYIFYHNEISVTGIMIRNNFNHITAAKMREENKVNNFEVIKSVKGRNATFILF